MKEVKHLRWGALARASCQSMSGKSTLHKLDLVKDVMPATIFDKLQGQTDKQKKRTGCA